jgi:hypothetical protein
MVLVINARGVLRGPGGLFTFTVSILNFVLTGVEHTQMTTGYSMNMTKGYNMNELGMTDMEVVLWTLAQTSGVMLIVGVMIVMIARTCVDARLVIASPVTGQRVLVLGAGVGVAEPSSPILIKIRPRPSHESE